MGIITALVRQKRNKERINVHLDGRFAFSLAESAAKELRVGLSLGEEELAALEAADEFEKAKQSAYRFLSYRPRSIVEVRRNLLGKQVEPSVVERVIARLTDLELLDDKAFARYWVEQRETFKPRSRIALRQELYQKGLGPEIVEEAVSQVDEYSAARKAAEGQARRWSSLTREEFYVKLGRYLQRRGFNYDIVKTVAAETWAATREESQSN